MRNKKSNPIIEGHRVCNCCLINKPIGEFTQDKSKTSGHKAQCKKCCKSKRKSQSKKPQSKKILSPKIKKDYVKKNRKKISDLERIENLRNYYRKKYNKKKTNPLFKLQHKYSRKIRLQIAKIKENKNLGYCNLMQVDLNYFKKYFESKFLSGMTWENYGVIWTVDHIRPQSRGKNEQEILKLNHYTNLKPMMSKENFSKGKRLTIEGLVKKYFPYDEINYYFEYDDCGGGTLRMETVPAGTSLRS